MRRPTPEKLKTLLCDCGQPAAVWKCNSVVCARCDELERRQLCRVTKNKPARKNSVDGFSDGSMILNMT
jgi:hypothetical protein